MIRLLSNYLKIIINVLIYCIIDGKKKLIKHNYNKILYMYVYYILEIAKKQWEKQQHIPTD